MSDIVEAVARAICVAEGIDPDKTSIGFGRQFTKGVKYKRWEAQRKAAEAAIAAVGVEAEQLRAQNERLRARVAVLESDRRERIATACLTGIASHPECPGFYTHYANEAVQYADALITRLDREVKP
jgi:hypothetical protein